MSRYVDHKHGLVVGSGNLFFIFGKKYERGDQGDFFACLWAQDYEFKSISICTVMINTPAQQILWRARENPIHSRDKYTLDPFIKGWLNKNVGEQLKDWDVHETYDYAHGAILFRRRKDALKLVRLIDEQLKGMHYPARRTNNGN